MTLALARQNAARGRLLDRLSALQRMIVRRAAPGDVLHAVVAGVADLAGGDAVSLCLLDPADPERTILAAGAGGDDVLRAQLEGALGRRLGDRAIVADRLVVLDPGSPALRPLPAVMDRAIRAAMAAPVHDARGTVGAIVVASRGPGRRYGPVEQEALAAFAQQASLALTDASMLRNVVRHAFHDALTDLPNRALFADRVELALRRARRSGSKVAVLFLDLDRFKIVNDSLGHAAGDELLRQVAGRLGASIRPGDTASRFGGDEFAILLEDVAGRAAAEQVAGRVLRALSAPLQIAGRDVFVTASIGISLGASSAADMIRNADLAMYRAKAAGKGRAVTFEPAMHAAVVERAELEADLQRVVERDQLVLHYQPIVALGNREVVGVEALVRWRHPTRGLVSPDAFIPLAEETLVMSELGRWILTEACSEVAAWRALRPLRLAVNISPIQLQDAGRLSADVAAALAASGLPAQALVLEITETALLGDLTETTAALRALKDLGVRLAVDHFGTGYSSLDYLRRFPIDILKIDKAFVADLVAGDSTLAQAIIDLGDSFGLQVVAEGIEHESQRRRLLELSCCYGQGHHFARPLPVAELGALLEATAART